MGRQRFGLYASVADGATYGAINNQQLPKLLLNLRLKIRVMSYFLETVAQPYCIYR